MEKLISTKEIYHNFKKISTDVMQNGTTYVVLKYSRPAYKIMPLKSGSQNGEKGKYNTKDISAFIFSSKNKKEKSLAKTFKKYLYQA